MIELPPENSLVTGRAGHEIFVVRDGTAHWVPDTWTMHAEGLSPRDLIVLDDDDLEGLRFGDDIPTVVPSPLLPPGTVVETESGIWEVNAGLLDYVADARVLCDAVFDDTRSVVWLPDSIVRGVRRSHADLERRGGGRATVAPRPSLGQVEQAVTQPPLLEVHEQTYP